MPVPEVILDIGFNGPTTGSFFTVGDPLRGAINNLPIGSSDIWVTISNARIRSWSVRYGAGDGDQPTLRYDAATAQIILNDPLREFDPANLAGPYVSAGVSQVEAMVRVRLRAVWDDISYPIFWGYADDWESDYQGNSWTYVTLTATDPLKVFAALDRTAGVSAGAGEDSGARIGRILDSASWPAASRLISTGDTLLQATDLSGNTLTELQVVQDTELGEFYFDQQGRAVFRNRAAMLADTRSNTSQATFGDAGYGVGEIPYADVTPGKPDGAVVNRVMVARVGGIEQTVEDVVSIARYLAKTHQRDDLLMQDDAGAASWGRALLYQFSTPQYRFAQLDFNTPSPEIEDVHWPQVLGRKIGDRITVRRRPAGGGSVIERDCFVRGVEHASDGVAWTSAFVLQSAERYSFFTIDNPVLGVIGSNAIAY